MPIERTSFDASEERWKRIEELNAVLERLRALRQPRVRFDNEKGLVAWCAESLSQLALHRIVALADGVCAEWNRGSALSGIIILRSAIETLALWWHSGERCEDLLRSGDLKATHLLLQKAIFGTKIAEPRFPIATEPRFPIATNVMTCIDKVDKSFPGFKSHYERVCELVHPNMEGMTLFGEVSEARELVIDERAGMSTMTLDRLVAGFAALPMAEVCLRRFIRLIVPRAQELERQYGMPTGTE
jgi:hypothetical protein